MMMSVSGPLLPLFLVYFSTRTTFTDMLIDNDPQITRHISIPRDMSSLSCSALTAGIVEAVLDGLGFVSLA
jgi:Transport protein particle (TRAPP) component